MKIPDRLLSNLFMMTSAMAGLRRLRIAEGLNLDTANAALGVLQVSEKKHLGEAE